jgi:hypothetical protein
MLRAACTRSQNHLVNHGCFQRAEIHVPGCWISATALSSLAFAHRGRTASFRLMPRRWSARCARPTRDRGRTRPSDPSRSLIRTRRGPGLRPTAERRPGEVVGARRAPAGAVSDPSDSGRGRSGGRIPGRSSAPDASPLPGVAASAARPADGPAGPTETGGPSGKPGTWLASRVDEIAHLAQAAARFKNVSVGLPSFRAARRGRNLAINGSRTNGFPAVARRAVRSGDKTGRASYWILWANAPGASELRISAPRDPQLAQIPVDRRRAGIRPQDQQTDNNPSSLASVGSEA